MSEKLGLVGRKIGMTRIFEEDGKSVPVTVLDVSGNRVACVKTVESDGYNAVQVAFGSKKPSRVNKALAGQFAKAGIEAVPSVIARTRAACSPASAWLVTSVQPSAPRRISWLPVSMLNVVFCSFAVPFPAPRAVKSLCVPP